MDRELNWTELGQTLRENMLEANEGILPSVEAAYGFLLDNPECFGREEWPVDLPATPNLELVAVYYGATETD